MNNKFWSGKRVFLTGHTGFKGSWLSLWLQKLGADVVGYALEPVHSNSLFTAANVAEGMQSVIGDICDGQKLARSMQNHSPEIVFHFAAQALVRESYLNPVSTFETNVMGTVNLLEAARHVPAVKAVVIVTTDKCYENREWLWGYRENEAMGGYDPYSSSKGCAELVTAAYRRSFFGTTSNGLLHTASIASARAGNVIGGGDWAKDRLIPDSVAAFLERRPVSIRHPNATRPWQHVLEPLSGYLALAEKLFTYGHSFAQAWNFGPRNDDSQSVGWVMDRMVKLWGEPAQWVQSDGEHAHEAQLLKLDISKANALLDWHPRTNLEDALRLTIDWYKLFSQGESSKSLCQKQIEYFSALTQDT